MPRTVWTQSSYWYYLKTLIARFRFVKNTTEPIKKQIEVSIQEYRNQYPNDEDSYIIEAEFLYYFTENATERREVVEQTLTRGIENCKGFAFACSLRLAIEHYEHGELVEAEKFLLKCKNHITNTDDNADHGKVCYFYAMSMLSRYFKTKETMSIDEVVTIRELIEKEMLTIRRYDLIKPKLFDRFEKLVDIFTDEVENRIK